MWVTSRWFGQDMQWASYRASTGHCSPYKKEVISPWWEVIHSFCVLGRWWSCSWWTNYSFYGWLRSYGYVLTYTIFFPHSPLTFLTRGSYWFHNSHSLSTPPQPSFPHIHILLLANIFPSPFPSSPKPFLTFVNIISHPLLFLFLNLISRPLICPAPLLFAHTTWLIMPQLQERPAFCPLVSPFLLTTWHGCQSSP